MHITCITISFLERTMITLFITRQAHMSLLLAPPNPCEQGEKRQKTTKQSEKGTMLQKIKVVLTLKRTWSCSNANSTVVYDRTPDPLMQTNVFLRTFFCS